MTEDEQKLAEQEAIAKALLIGEQMRREDNSDIAWYARRIGIAISVVGFVLLLMLFAFTTMSKDAGIPIMGLLTTAAIIGAGAVTAYWGYSNSKKEPSDLDF